MKNNLSKQNKECTLVVKEGNLGLSKLVSGLELEKRQAGVRWVAEVGG